MRNEPPSPCDSVLYSADGTGDVSSVGGFYDLLSDSYDEFVGNWEQAVGRQGRLLDHLLRYRVQDRSLSVWDAACGIGTQSLGLAACGHAVVGSDLSRRAVQRARREAAARRLNIPFVVADMRQPCGVPTEAFDAVVCADNSLPHLLTRSDVLAALAAMRRRLRAGGVVAVSTRDYDRHRKARPVATQPVRSGGSISFQTWDWLDADCYVSRAFLLRRAADGWVTECLPPVTYRAWSAEELRAAAEHVGLQQVCWLSPADSGYHQPIMLAARGT